MNGKIEYRNLDNVNVTSFIESGKTKLFDSHEEAYEYATLKRSYTYYTEVWEERKDNLYLIGYGYAVPQ